MKRVGDVLSFLLSAFVVVAFSIAALNWIIPRLGPNDYITTYFRHCIAKVKTAELGSYYECKQNNGSTYVLSRRFRVDYDRQRVFALGLLTSRYDNCDVADTYNWDCRYADGSGGMSMADGKFANDPFDALTEQVSWWQYQIDQR